MTHEGTVSSTLPPRPAHGYLDTPSMGLPGAGTVDVMRAALDDWALGRADYLVWEHSMAACRALFGSIVDVNPEEVGLLPSVVPAVSAVAATLAEGCGVVVAHRKEFRSLLLPVLAQVGEDRIRWVDGPYLADTFIDALDGGVDAVIVSAVSSHDGARISLARLDSAARSAGSILVVDGTQAAGIVVPDVAVGELALFTCAGYKGLRGPRGVAYAVAHDDVVARFAAPSAYGVADARERGSYGPPLIRKRGGAGLDQSPAWLAWVGSEPALAELAQEPADRRERRVLQLASRLREQVDGLGLAPQATDLPSSIVTFEVHNPEMLIERLASAGIRASSRLGRVRLGLHVYNDEHDVDLACEALDDAFQTSQDAKEPTP